MPNYNDWKDTLLSIFAAISYIIYNILIPNVFINMKYNY